AKTDEQVIAYVSIFQMEGNNLHKWINTLKMLDHYSQSRPVYRTEEQVRAIIRTKSEQLREAYVVIEIKENDIIPLSAGRTAVDRLGNELLTLKRGAIQPENIIEFVHSEHRYDFVEGQLVLQQKEQETVVPDIQFSMAAQAA
ncbi:MAG: Dot/Icm secretion system protein IcmQ, partial [Gammaproteobacteria bacterium]